MFRNISKRTPRNIGRLFSQFSVKRWLNSQLRSLAETPFPTLWLLSTLWWVNSKRRETTPEEFPGKKKGTCGQFGGGGGGKIPARSEIPGKNALEQLQAVQVVTGC